MRFQKAIKRMIALGTGAVMLSGSVFGAADLANFPAPFIKDGKFSGVLIVGDKAAAEDVIGISDIHSSLQFAAVKKVTTTSGGDVTVEGDAWKVGSSSKKLELSEDLTTGGSSSRETLRNITTYIDKANLKALASGSVTNNKVTSPYNQYLYLLGPGVETSMDSGYVVYSENSDDDVTADYLFFKSGKEMFRYLIEFTTSLESDVDDSSGSSSATGLFLTDYQDVDLTLFGKKYTIVTAKRVTTTGSEAVLTLMGGANKDTLLEKQTKTYTIGGKPYEVTLNFVDTDEAQFVINGQSSRKLKDGDTDKLADGTTIGVTDILYQDYAGGIHSATFFLGANKIELKDTNIDDTLSSNQLKVDDNTIDDATVMIEGDDNNATFKITRIHVNMSADDDYFVPAGGKLSEAIKAAGGSSAEPQVLFTENWDVEYKGLSKESLETVKIRRSGSSQYNLEFLDGGGNKVDVPIAKSPSGASLIFGEQNKAFINKENRTIAKDDYFVLSDSTSGRKRGERATYVLQYKGADKVTNDNPVLKFKNLGDGKTIEQTFSAASSIPVGVPGALASSGGELATLKVGGSDFKVFNTTAVTSNDFGILIDLDASGGISEATNASGAGANVSWATAPLVITTKSGMEINVTNETGTGVGSGDDVYDIVRVNFLIPDESRDGSARDSVESLKPTNVRIDISAASGKVAFVLNTSGDQAVKRINFRTPDGKTNIAYAYDSYGNFYTHETPTSDPAEMNIQVAAKQRVPLVYISSKGTTFSESGVSTTEAVTVQRIQVGAAKLASEVTDVKAQNTILVGGPCANAAAATVLGNPADCTAGFTPGEGRVELYEHANGNVAMLVAGYGAVDTRNAATVVANYGDYKGQLKGTKVVVKKVNNQLTVAAPATV